MSTLEQEISAAPPPRTAAPARSELDRALAARDYERAERLLADAIARQPTSRQLLTQIASVFMMDRKPLNAAIALKKAEALGPLDNHARLQLALAYIAMRRGDWARPELERLASAEPDNVIHPTGLPGWTTMPASTPRRFAGCRTSSPRRRRLPARTTTWACATKRSTSRTRRSRTTARRCGSTASTQGAVGLAAAQSRHPAPHARRTGRGRNLVSRGVDLRSAASRPVTISSARSSKQRGRMDEAVKALRQATALDAAYPEPYYALSRIYRSRVRSPRPTRRMTTFKRLHDAAAGATAVTIARVTGPHRGARVSSCAWRSRHSQRPRRVSRTTSRPGRRSSRSPFCSNAATCARPVALVEPALKAHPADPVLHNFAGVIAAQQGAFDVGRGALSDGDSPRADRAPPRTRTSDASIRSAPTAIPRCAPRRLRSTAGCWTPSPASVEGLFQSGFLLALDGQFAASRAMLERLPEEVRQRPQALAVLAADLAGLGDAAAARAVVDVAGGASGADGGRRPRRASGAAERSGRRGGRA